MVWPYHFVNLDSEQIHARRELLDRYGSYAQLSALIPVLIYQLYRLAVWVSSERQRATQDYMAVPSSPAMKQSKRSSSGLLASKWRTLLWWLGTQIYPGWGTNGQWIAGMSWASWLMFLSLCQTGNDYLHLTKRFGTVAASQFPIHYMLSMKSRYSPLALGFQTSHEELNTYHRALGRILYSFLILHGVLYMNFFIQAGILKSKLTSIVVLIGIVALALMTVLASTSLAAVRRWSYRVFFVLHLVIGISILPLLFFHAHALRLYVVEAAALFILDLVARKLDTVTGFAKITFIPQTKLLKIRVPIPPSKIDRFKSAAGQHVYLSIPPESTPSQTPLPSIHDLLFNPFTIADVSDSTVTLVLRVLRGPTTRALEHLTRLSKANPPLNLEGPYGTSKHFPNLGVHFDRILLVAGGVGATYIIPIYHQIQSSAVREGLAPSKVSLIWSMKVVAEAAWTAEPDGTKSFAQDENIKIFLTGSESVSLNTPLPEDGSVEMVDLQKGDPGDAETGRPDLRQVVNDTFRHDENERVAVLVCGPAGMADEVRGYIGRWVAKGRHVWWHDESFGW